MADLTSLEQQIMKDYGQYITVPLTPARAVTYNEPTGFNILNMNRRQNVVADKTALTNALPAGVTFSNNQLQITPNSDLYKKYIGDLSGKPEFNSKVILNDIISGIKKQQIPTVGSWNNLFSGKQPQNSLGGALRMLGVPQPPTYNQFGQHPGLMGIVNRFNAPAAPVNTPATLQTRTLEEAMKQYADKNNMPMDKLLAQINATKAAREQIVQNTPRSVEDVNRMMYAQPVNNELSGLEQKYAQGGAVRTGYAEGDLVEVAPDYNEVPMQQVEPTGGGYVAPQMLSANPELNALLQRYDTGSDYSKQLEQARQQRSSSEAEFNKSMENLISSTDAGPSKSELYWRLAAAFGTPAGKTGNFGENLASAAGTMGEYGKEQRASEQAKRKLKAEIGMKKQEMALESAKDTEKTLLGLQSEANKDRREMIKATVKEYIDSGKPQSEAGRIAKDKGLKVGTPEYQAEVDNQANILIEKQLGAIKAQMLSSQATLAGLGVQQAKEAREAVKLEPDERKAIRDDEDAIAAAKSTAKNIDEAIGLVDKAFSNTIPDKALYRKLKQTNPQDPRVVATEQLENLLGTNVLGSLRATFGGNPTEGERSALRDLQGLSGASPESRKKILERSKKSLTEAAEHRSMRINKIETGGYRKKAKD